MNKNTETAAREAGSREPVVPTAAAFLADFADGAGEPGAPSWVDALGAERCATCGRTLEPAAPDGAFTEP